MMIEQSPEGGRPRSTATGYVGDACGLFAAIVVSTVMLPPLHGFLDWGHNVSWPVSPLVLLSAVTTWRISKHVLENIDCGTATAGTLGALIGTACGMAVPATALAGFLMGMEIHSQLTYVVWILFYGTPIVFAGIAISASKALFDRVRNEQ